MFTLERKLETQGNSWYLYLNKSIAQLLGITPQERNVKLVVSDKILHVEKALDPNEPALIKKLITRSSGYGLNMPLPILELLDINPESDLVEISVNNNQLTIKKAIE